MGNLTAQPWWVDLGIVLLPIAVTVTLIYLIRGRNCVECGHKAVKLHMNRNYCERCFRVKFGVPDVAAAKPAPVIREAPASAPAPMVATRASRKASRRSSKKAG